MISPPIASGPKHKIVFITHGAGSADTFDRLAESLRAQGPLADQLLGKQSKPNERPSEWKNLLALMRRTVLHGLAVTSRNNSKCRRSLRYDASDVGEFISRPYRVMFFEDPETPGLIVITHWFKKKRDDTPDTQIDRALRMRQEYLDWKHAQET